MKASEAGLCMHRRWMWGMSNGGVEGFVPMLAVC